MTAKDWIAAVFLVIGVLIQLLCSLGVLVMPNAYSKMHYLGPASTLGIGAVALAVIVSDPGLQSAPKAAIITGLFLASGPVMSHATARAVRVRKDPLLDKTTDNEER